MSLCSVCGNPRALPYGCHAPFCPFHPLPKASTWVIDQNPPMERTILLAYIDSCGIPTIDIVRWRYYSIMNPDIGGQWIVKADDEDAYTWEVGEREATKPEVGAILCWMDIPQLPEEIREKYNID
jgi:hypothetical protein